MHFDPDNSVIRLCAQGMEEEGKGCVETALGLFQQAWNCATNDFERFIAAHYLARNRADLHEALYWNIQALQFADTVGDEGMKPYYPSLYLNIGKSYEDMGDIAHAVEYYNLARAADAMLPEDGYGKMIKAGIEAGLKRTHT